MKGEVTESFVFVVIAKYYEKKKYFPKTLLVSISRRTVSILPVSMPIDLVSFRVSLPLSAYTGSPVPSLDVLLDRMLHLRALPDGMCMCITV